MPKFILAPDSFKGSISAVRFCEIVSEAIARHFPDSQVIQVPLADGGEGTADCVRLALGAEVVEAGTLGPRGQQIRAHYARTGDTAVIEMASAAGLWLAGDHPDPGLASTQGVGLLIRHAIQAGCRVIRLGLGGKLHQRCRGWNGAQPGRPLL